MLFDEIPKGGTAFAGSGGGLGYIAFVFFQKLNQIGFFKITNGVLFGDLVPYRVKA